MSHKGLKSLFLCDSSGRLISRRPDVWSIHAKACLMCGTTAKKHEAKGYCRLCYLKWRRANNKEWRDRINAKQKQRFLKTDYQELYDAARKDKPERKANRREISNRYADKHSKWPRGSKVIYLLGAIPIKGVIMEKTNTQGLVQFATYQEWIPFARLRKPRIDE